MTQAYQNLINNGILVHYVYWKLVFCSQFGRNNLEMSNKLSKFTTRIPIHWTKIPVDKYAQMHA